MNKTKKLISILLAAILFVSPLAQDRVLADKVDDGHIKTEVVEKDKKERLIVELKDSSILDMANRYGKSIDDLDKEKVCEEKDNIEKGQDNLLDKISNKGIDVDNKDVKKYDTALNAVSFEAKKSDIEDIEKLPEVKKVYISQEFTKPLTNSANEIIGSDYAWNTGKYKGEGTVVAVIDSGLDFNHKALRLDSKVNKKLTREDVTRLVDKYQLSGKYYSDKVPYGFNYYDYSENLFDSYGVMHGMHVTGIIGANDSEGHVTGVAPNAQILAMKIFSDDLEYPTTFTDVWLKALDDALALGADVINMSLGAPAGFSNEGRNHPEIEILRKARQAGVVVSIAAGNDRNIVDGNTYKDKALRENYDTSLIANPAVNEDSIAVASMENSKRQTYAVRWTDRNNKEQSSEISLYAPSTVDDVIQGQVVDLNTGADVDFKTNKLKDSIVMLEIPDKDHEKELTGKVLKAIEEKPKALVFYNNSKSEDKLSGRLDFSGGKLNDYPVAVMKRETRDKINAEKLYALDFRISIDAKGKFIDNEEAGSLSNFSSWGPSPDLRIKPELTAVGGHVYSTAEDDKYKNMSGTPMAAPQVAGASAIIRQYLEDIDHKVEDVAGFTKLLLMNTAIPLKSLQSSSYAPYFVRQQGAGAINLEHALKSGVVVTATGTNDDTEDGKLELKELKDRKFDVNLKFENFGKKEKNYNIFFTALYESLKDGRRSEIAEVVSSNQANVMKSVNLKPGEVKTINFTMDYSDAEDIRQNDYLEGFITMEDQGEDQVDLCIPFLGFYGNWSGQKAIDAFNIPEIGQDTRQAQFYVNKETDTKSSSFVSQVLSALPIVDNTVYFSPGNKYFNDAMVRLSILRNADKIEYSIIDKESGKELRKLGQSINVRKMSRLSRDNSFRYMPDSIWDGMINGEYAQENKDYIYQIKVKLNGSHEEQIYKYPIRIDRKDPTIDKAQIISDGENDPIKYASFITQDEGIGIKNIYIESVKYKKGNEVTRDDLTPPGEGSPEKSVDEKDTTSKDIRPVYNTKAIRINFVDYESEDGKKLNRIEDGKLIIKREDVPNQPAVDKTINVYRNGHKNDPIQVVVPFYADTTHVNIGVMDRLSNVSGQILPTGVKNDYQTITVLDFAEDVEKYKTEYSINGQKLEKMTFASNTGKAEIKIKMGGDYHVSGLNLYEKGLSNHIITNDVIDTATAQKFNYRYDHGDNSVNITIDPLDKNYELDVKYSPGPMKADSNAMIKLKLDDSYVAKFSKYKLNNKDISLEGEDLATNKGSNLYEFIYKGDKKFRDVKEVNIYTNGVKTSLPSLAQFSVTEGQKGYSNSNFSLIFRCELQADSKLEVVYSDKEVDKKEENSNIPQPSPRPPFDLDTPPGSIGNENEIINSNNAKDKYPAIFLQSPSLLEVNSAMTVEDNKIKVNGFVGYLRDDDKIRELKVYLVDGKGNKISEEVVISNSTLKNKFVNYTVDKKIIYSGFGKYFYAELPLKDFNADVKAEVVTEKGYRASVVRRTFFDNVSPEISYEVVNRDLNSNKATVNIKSTDNSFKLSLYNNDSLVDKIDNTSVSYNDKDVAIEKQIVVELEEGQNKIDLKAVDLANNTVKKTVYIYRTNN